MNTIRTGKIARLPPAVREELNRRLLNGERGTWLCAWLHALPAVRAVLAAEFGGRPINAPNLTAWRQGGYRDWKEQADAGTLARQLKAETPEASARMREHLLGGQCLTAMQQITESGHGKKGWRLLRRFCGDVVRLREMELARQRRELDREWGELHATTADRSGISLGSPE
ncbi:MAG: hypothetical protein P4L99_03800 [Chthoniobacter sp.]|nr:hypothetical protein [Chthoniobacter sp.]